jgi:hypothetical protein
MAKPSIKAAKRRTRKPLEPARKISDRQLLIHWAVVLQQQQLWIAQIITSLGAPLFPGLCNQILQKLSRDHFNNWLEEGVPVDLIEGLLKASIEEKSVTREIATRLKGKVVSSLRDLVAGKIGNSDNLNENVKEVRSTVMVDRICERFPNKKFPIVEENEDARSYAFLDAWEELNRMNEAIIKDLWLLPTAENEFEAVLFERWQSRVLPALKGLGIHLLPMLLKGKDVNYLPSSLAKDRIDRLKHKNAKKRTGMEVDDQILDRHLSGGSNPEEAKAISRNRFAKCMQGSRSVWAGDWPRC